MSDTDDISRLTGKPHLITDPTEEEIRSSQEFFPLPPLTELALRMKRGQLQRGGAGIAWPPEDEEPA